MNDGLVADGVIESRDLECVSRRRGFGVTEIEGLIVVGADVDVDCVAEDDKVKSLVAVLLAEGVIERRDGLSRALRVGVVVYFSHRHPSAVLSSAQLPFMYITTASWVPPAFSGCPGAQLQYVRHVPVVFGALKKAWPCPLPSCARYPVFHRKTVSPMRFPPNIARTSAPPTMYFAAKEFRDALPIVASFPCAPMQALLHVG